MATPVSIGVAPGFATKDLGTKYKLLASAADKATVGLG